MVGITRKVLHVDLSSRKCRRETYEHRLFEKYLGGMGLGMYFLDKLLLNDTDPLSPLNVLVFAAGPLAGTFLPGSSRLDILTRSPINGLLATSNVGAFFAAKLKYSLIDLIIIRGKAAGPCYLYIDEKNCFIGSAAEMWGKGCFETMKIIRSMTPEKLLSICAIGPGGENLVFTSSITFDDYHSAARGGVGAVMGSKNLKAIICGGDCSFPVAHPREADELRKRLIKKVTPWKKEKKADGTIVSHADPERGTSLARIFRIKPGIPGHNFSKSFFTDWAETVNLKRKGVRFHEGGQACFSCPRGESAVTVESDSGCYKMAAVHNSHIFSWGALCGLKDVRHIWEIARECEDLGLDSISAAGSIGAMIACTENGIIDDLPEKYRGLTWNSLKPLKILLNDIAFQRDLGKQVRNGTDSLIKIYGEPASRFVNVIRGMEWYPLDPREDIGVASLIGPLISARVGDNLKSTHIAYFYEHLPVSEEITGKGKEPSLHRSIIDSLDLPPELKRKIFPENRILPETYNNKEYLVKWVEDKVTIMNAMGQCILLNVDMQDFPEMIRTVTGRKFGLEELQEIAQRILTLQRNFNIKNGLLKQEVNYPDRYYNESKDKDESMNKTLDRDRINKVIRNYYRLRGWNGEQGTPGPLDSLCDTTHPVDQDNQASVKN